MNDLGTMLWKEWAEFRGNRRAMRLLGIAVVLFGLLPILTGGHHRIAPGVADALYPVWVLFSSVIVVAQTGPDLILRERNGKTLEALLASRMSDGAIFAGKVLTAMALGYGATMLTAAIQLVGLNLHAGLGQGWHWMVLTVPQARLIVFVFPLCVDAYLAVVGAFVALRVGDQRAAYLVTMLAMGVVVAAFALGWIPIHFTTRWLTSAAGVWALGDVLLIAIGVRLFRRQRLILYLQD